MEHLARRCQATRPLVQPLHGAWLPGMSWGLAPSGRGGERELASFLWSAMSPSSDAMRETASSLDLNKGIGSGGGPVPTAAEPTKETGGRLGALH